MNKKIFKTVLLIVLLSAAIIGFIIYNQVFSGNTKFSEKEVFVNIPTNSKYEDVKKIIDPYIDNMDKFEFIAKKRSYNNNIKSGRFLLKSGMSSFALVTSLRQNITVKLAFNNQERIEDLAGRVGSQIEADSLSVLNSFKEPAFLAKNGLTEDDVLAICLPNTYEMYWNTSAEKFRDKMLKEYQNFWTSERIAKAKAQNLTPIQATILASIVHKESVKKDERPTIASVYLNRMKIEMLLQADPTAIYAAKKAQNDFTIVIKRVLDKHTALASPWNTYYVNGLPPGPIAMPDVTALEAVLNPKTTDYLYFCASVEKFGYHEFATTLAEHNVNGDKYHEWISKQPKN